MLSYKSTKSRWLKTTSPTPDGKLQLLFEEHTLLAAVAVSAKGETYRFRVGSAPLRNNVCNCRASGPCDLDPHLAARSVCRSTEVGNQGVSKHRARVCPGVPGCCKNFYPEGALSNITPPLHKVLITNQSPHYWRTNEFNRLT